MAKRLFSIPNDFVEFDCQVVHTTDRAYLVEVLDTGEQEWIPKSQVEDMTTTDQKSTMVIPEWLAKEKNIA